MLSELLYATNNPGKKVEISKLLNSEGIKVVTPSDLGVNLDVSEIGNTLEENAALKVNAFLSASQNRIVLADDTGLEIDALNGEPGIHVRRWKDGKTRMDDEEIILYCLELMKNIPHEQRGAQFRTVLALGIPGRDIEIYDGTLRGTILEKPADFRVEGFPFESLLFVSEWGMLLGEARELKPVEGDARLNHREKALQKAVARIKELLK